eukprot:12908194-Prorocentrum_lima.AAC.1
MEAIPQPIQAHGKQYGIFDSIGILVRVVREVMPAMDYSVMCKLCLPGRPGQMVGRLSFNIGSGLKL